MSLTVSHLGGENTVTGSCHLLRTEDCAILIDCGLAQGLDQALPVSKWPVPPAEIDFLFLTHAHIDHIGRVPELLGGGFRGEIICSHPTKALLRPMLQDALKFQPLPDCGPSSHRCGANELLTEIDRLAWGFEYGERFSLKKGVEFELGRAGHILGSCFIHFFFSGLPSTVPGRDCYSVIFSGDLGGKDTPLLPDPDPPGSCDLLILESTYGDRLHADRGLRQEILGQVLQGALADNGKVFIPAFALGRTQELLYEINHSALAGSVPVFIDSPLGVGLTEVYSSLTEFWDREARDLLAAGDHPIDFKRLYSTVNFKAHRELLDFPGPAIIIAGSGMCTGGRIIDHLATGLSDPQNDLLFVGYQARHTLGRKIIEQSRAGSGAVSIDGRRVPVKAKVRVMGGYSAHADQQGLLDWVASMPQPPGKIKLVHGEQKAKAALERRLKGEG